MRVILVALLVVVIAEASCIETGGYGMEVINRSDTLLCRHGWSCSDSDSMVAPGMAEIWHGECDTNKSPVTIGVTEGEGGQLIYERDAICEQWDDAVLIVGRRNGELIVVDNLTDAR